MGTSLAEIVEPKALAVRNPTGETAGAATAMQAKASIEARYLMAMQQPRSIMKVRERLLDSCKRPRFAEKARYAKPVGGQKIIGFTIRFAEELARCLTNVLCESMVVYDDADQRIVRVVVTDLEANVSYPHDVVVRKTVERNSVKAGAVVVGERTGSNGQRVFIVAATDDDLQNKQAALVSKAMRTGLLRICPADILEEAEEAVVKTLRREDAADPASAVKRIADSFHSLGVGADDLEKFLGHPITRVSAAEVQLLREMHAALKEEDVTWKELSGTFGQKSDVDAETKVGVQAVRQALAAKKAAAPVAPPAPAPAPAPAVREREAGEDDEDFE